MTEMPLGQVKARLSEVVERVHATHDRVVITRHGKADAVIIAMDDLVSMEETIQVLSDTEAMKAIVKAREEIARGTLVEGDDIRKRFLGGGS